MRTQILFALLIITMIVSATDFNTCAYTISSSGTYRLTSNLACTGHGVTVNNGVTNVVINLNGYTIDGDDGASDYGIRCFSGCGGLTISNGTITDFARGVTIGTGAHSGVEVSNVTFSSNAIGIYTGIDDVVTGYLFKNNTITSGTSEGINLDSSGSPTVGTINVIQNVITGNGGNGQIVIGANVNANVSYNNLTGSTTGIAIWSGSAVQNITGNFIYNITQAGVSGIYFQNGGANSIFNGNIFYNDSYPIQADSTITFNNTIIGYNSTVGKATFTNFTISGGLREGVTSYFQPTFISIDTDTLTGIGGNAIMIMQTDAACANTTVYKKTGFPSTYNAIIGGTVVGTSSSCTDGLASYTATSFSGYAMGNGTSITSSLANSYETETSTLSTTFGSVLNNVTEYNITIYYNNTLLYSSNTTGINQSSVTINRNVIAPLVDTTKNISYNVSVSMLAGSVYSATILGNQTVTVWYNISNYTVSFDNTNTIEDTAHGTVSVMSNPPNAATSPTIAYSYTLTKCDDIWAGATNATNTTTCPGASITSSSIGSFSRLSSHRQETANVGGGNRRLIKTSYYVSRTYNLSFSPTVESASAKTISVTNSSNNNDTYVWLVGADNGGTYPLTSVTTSVLLNGSVIDEFNSSSIIADYYNTDLYLRFNDLTTKTYNISNTSTANGIVRVYPNVGSLKLFGYEEYQETSPISYTTRRRIYADTLDFNTTYAYNMRLLQTYYSTITRVMVSGYSNADYVKIYKKQGTSYIQLDDRYLDSSYQAIASLYLDAYYRVDVYDAEGNLLASMDDMQIDCSISCRLSVSTNTQTDISNSYIMQIEGTCYEIPTKIANPNVSSIQKEIITADTIRCNITNNPGNFNLTLRNYLGENKTLNCTNVSINSATVSCELDVDEYNLWQLTVEYNGGELVIASGGIQPQQDMQWMLDGAIIVVFIILGLVLFIWQNIIVAGMLMSGMSVLAWMLRFVPIHVAALGGAFGILIVVVGMLKKKQ